jgi:outer membrane protein assembly factor BamB
LLGDEALYFSTEAGSIYVLDYNGTTLWNRAVGGKLYTTPVLASDKILVATTGKDEIIFAFDKSGNQLWAFIPEKKK